MSFSIKRTLGARKGWKIMADDGQAIEGSALRTVVGMIKDLEFQVRNHLLLDHWNHRSVLSLAMQGFSVPERITIKIP